MLQKMRRRVALLRGLVDGQKAYNAPFNASINITQRCNLRCVGCVFHSEETDYQPDPSVAKDISLLLFERICRELADLGTTGLVITGTGEPMLHSQILEMIKSAKRCGFHVSLFTNGTLLNDESIKGLIESGLDLLQVSFWGGVAEDFERCMPGARESNLELAVERIKTMNALKKEFGSSTPAVHLNCPINKHNYQHLMSLMEVCFTTKSQALTFSPIRNWGDSFQGLVLDDDELTEVRETLHVLRRGLEQKGINHKIGMTLKRYDIGENVWEALPCYIGWLHVRFDPEGNVRPCGCDQVMGRIGDEPLVKIWNNADYRNFRSRIRSKEGLEKIAKSCDCGFCCHLPKNYHVHRYFKWIAPIVGCSE